MYVGISTQTFDLRGSILFKANIADTELDNITRRVTRTATLDGGVSINDSGYSDGDRTLNISASLDEGQTDRLKYIFKNYSEVIMAIPEGIFLVNLNSLNNVHGEVVLQVYVSEKLAPIEIPAYYCSRDDTFHNLNWWYVTKLHGTETATSYLKGITDYECKIDLPDSLDTQITMLYQYLLPVGDFSVDLSTSDYTPDNATNGFTFEFKIRSDTGTYYSSIKFRSTASGVYTVTKTHKDGVFTYTDLDTGVSDVGSVRITRVGNELSIDYFTDSWQTEYTHDFGSNSSEPDRVEIIAYDTSTRGGSIDIDNLMFRQGCPEQYPKAWSTTTTSSTMTSTSTASTTSSSSSFSSTTSSTSSTSSTTSSSSSTSSTASTTSTTMTGSTTSSSITTTSSTASTTSTTSSSSTTSSTSSTASTTSSISTTSSTASSSSTSSTASTTSSTASSSSTSSTASTASTTSSTASSTSTLSTTSSTMTGSTTLSTTSTLSTVTTTTSPPCEYDDDFDDLSDMQITKLLGTEEAEITGGKLRLHLPSTGNSEITAWHRYQIPSGNFDIQVDISDYIPDASTSFIMMLEVSDGVSTRPETDSGVLDWAAVLYNMDGSNHYTKLRYKYNGAYTNGTAHNRSGMPSKLRLKRLGTIISFDYYLSGSWYNDGTKDFLTRADNLTALGVAITDRVNTGGEGKFDGLVFVDGCPTGTPAWTSTSTTTTMTTTTSSTASTTSSTSSTSSTASTVSSTTTSTALCEYDEYFNNLDYWTVTNNNEHSSSTIFGNKLKMLVTDGNSGATACDYDYHLPAGDFDIRIDLESYYSEVSVGGAEIFLRVSDALVGPDNDCYVAYYVDSGHKIKAQSTINDVAGPITTNTRSGPPSRLRMVRDGTTLKAYYFMSSTWYLIASWDFSSYASTLYLIVLYLECDNGGGLVYMDNLKFVEGCPGAITSTTTTTTTTLTTTSSTASTTSSTASTTSTTASTLSTTTTNTCAYHEFFGGDLSLWQLDKDAGDETATIVGGELRMHVNDSQSSDLLATYKYTIPSGDFDVQIDLTAYTPDSSTNGHRFYFCIANDVGRFYPTITNFCRIRVEIDNGTIEVASQVYYNSSQVDLTQVTPGSMPTALRIVRIGTKVYSYYYLSGAWNGLSTNVNFSSAVDTVNLQLTHGQLLRGGEVKLDDLMFVDGCPTGGTAW